VAETEASDTASLRRWALGGVAASILIVLSLPLYLVKERLAAAGADAPSVEGPTFVGRDTCLPCHESASEAWRGSDHDRAMAVADESTVLGDFDDAVLEHHGTATRFFRRDGKYMVQTQGPDGEPGEFEVAYTFGFEPLQQYLIPFPGGRLQSLTVAWDTEQDRWFHLYPDQDIPPGDWLHWTRGGQNWNGMCAQCHSTNIRKGYDPDSGTFQTSWSEIDVSCEACHGPGSRHVAWAEIEPMARPDVDDYELAVHTGDVSARQQVELCAPCHSRRLVLDDHDHTGAELLNTFVPQTLDQVLYFPDGQILEEVYVHGSFVQSKMYRNDVRCGDCHDVHSLKLVEQGNALCLQCHRADDYDAAAHHFHKKVHEGQPSDGALCVKCHMPERAYMVVDYRADHSLRVPRPDLSLEIGVPNACAQSGCHDDKPTEWSADHFRRWYGMARKPHYGSILEAGRQRLPEAGTDLIRLAADGLYSEIVRATALALLEAYPGPETTAAFTRALGDDEALVRHTALSHLAPLGPDELVDLVAPLLFDPVRAVRTEAAVRLAEIPRERLRPYQNEALDSGLLEFRRGMEYSLDFPFAGHNLGNLELRLKQPQRAAEYYLQTLEIDDLFYPAKVNLAHLYNSMGKNGEAERLLREILVAYPEMHEVAYSLGLLLAELKRYPEATVFLQQASEGIPERARIHYNLGLAQQYLGRNSEAERALCAAVDLEPEDLGFLYALADHYLKRDRPRLALAVAERMIAAHPDAPVGRELKGMVERELRSR
jgi:tetratricopeptide (TPR) repeat protein